MQFSSINQILDFAIREEEKAADFYNGLAERVARREMQALFRSFAQEEMGHKAKLLAAKEGNLLAKTERKILDLKIGDHLEQVELTPNLSYQDALILAMKAEKNAFRLYTSLAEQAADPALKDMLESLAQEEARHKLRFEMEYDEMVYTQN